MPETRRRYHGRRDHVQGLDTFEAACRKADAKGRTSRAAELRERPDEHLEFLRELMADDNLSLEAVYCKIHQRHFRDHAAASVIEAVVYELRTHGLAQLKNPHCRRRLGELSPEQMCEVLARLIKLRPQYPKIDDELLLQLEERLP